MGDGGGDTVTKKKFKLTTYLHELLYYTTA